MFTFFIVLTCLFINALLSCAEMAFVTIDKQLLRKETLRGNQRAIYLEAMQELPERILSVVQIGITLVGAISAAVSGALAEERFTPWIMEVLNINEDIAETIAIAMVVIPLTILSVIIGELVPKSIAIRYSFRICMLLAPGLKLAEKVLGFLVTPMEKMTNFLVNIFLPVKKNSEKKNQSSEISLEGLKSEHKLYIQNLVDLDAKIVSSAMVGWDSVKTIHSEATGQEVYDLVLNYNHTRIPVMDNHEVYGFLHLKEFLHLSKAGVGDNWLSFIRSPVFVAPETRLLDALKLMKVKKVQMLIVGTSSGPLGILTLQDVIEEVVGDMMEENEDKRIVGYLRYAVIRNKKIN